MTPLDRLIHFSLQHRVLVIAGAGLLPLLGGWWTANLPIDIFPDLSAPTVTVITEAPGSAPEEMETEIERLQECVDEAQREFDDAVQDAYDEVDEPSEGEEVRLSLEDAKDL